jgi:hypothetical protein
MRTRIDQTNIGDTRRAAAYKEVYRIHNSGNLGPCRSISRVVGKSWHQPLVVAICVVGLGDFDDNLG